MPLTVKRCMRNILLDSPIDVEGTPCKSNCRHGAEHSHVDEKTNKPDV